MKQINFSKSQESLKIWRYLRTQEYIGRAVTKPVVAITPVFTGIPWFMYSHDNSAMIKTTLWLPQNVQNLARHDELLNKTTLYHIPEGKVDNSLYIASDTTLSLQEALGFGMGTTTN